MGLNREAVAAALDSYWGAATNKNANQDNYAKELDRMERAMFAAIDKQREVEGANVKVYIVSESDDVGGDEIIAVCTLKYVAEEIQAGIEADNPHNTLNEIWEVEVNELIS